VNYNEVKKQQAKAPASTSRGTSWRSVRSSARLATIASLEDQPVRGKSSRSTKQVQEIEPPSRRLRQTTTKSKAQQKAELKKKKQEERAQRKKEKAERKRLKQEAKQAKKEEKRLRKEADKKEEEEKEKEKEKRDENTAADAMDIESKETPKREKVSLSFRLPTLPHNSFQKPRYVTKCPTPDSQFAPSKVKHLWGYYETKEELEQLLSWLDERGLREQKLKATLNQYLPRITAVMEKRIQQLENPTNGTSRRSTRIGGEHKGPTGYVNKYNTRG